MLLNDHYLKVLRWFNIRTKSFVTLCLSLFFLSTPTLSQTEKKVDTGREAQKQNRVIKKILFIASDMKNGGVSGVYNAFLSAAHELRWEVNLADLDGDLNLAATTVLNTLPSPPDGIVLGGLDLQPSLIEPTRSKKIAIVGWHSGPNPGPAKGMLANITTDPIQVARIAANSIGDLGHIKNPGVIILTDSRFAIAVKKSDEMKRVVTKSGYKVLLVKDLPISEAGNLIPSMVAEWNKKFGDKWTHTLAINDVYFDHMNIPLLEAKRKDIINISAGDGSKSAIGRIKSGMSQQAATVAEPLVEQGWQLADELFRAFSQKPWSQSISKPILINNKYLNDKNPFGTELQQELKRKYLDDWQVK